MKTFHSWRHYLSTTLSKYRCFMQTKCDWTASRLFEENLQEIVQKTVIWKIAETGSIALRHRGLWNGISSISDIEQWHPRFESWNIATDTLNSFSLLSLSRSVAKVLTVWAFSYPILFPLCLWPNKWLRFKTELMECLNIWFQGFIEDYR